MRRVGVEIHNEKEIASGAIARLKTDALVVAIGGKSVIPSIPGIELPHVALAKDVLLGKAEVGDPIVIIGGGQVGLEVAEHLGEKGKKITVIELLDELARGMPSITKLSLLCRLEELGVTILMKAKVKKIRSGEVFFQYKGAEQRVAANTVIIAAGSEPDTEFLEKVKGKIAETYVIGDALKPRRILEAIAEGFDIGMKV
jgi:pyruvate/2-oxoglutarate dehydrogenase complex dihydrolipoamide dehydrogenase (E3) component